VIFFGGKQAENRFIKDARFQSVINETVGFPLLKKINSDMLIFNPSEKVKFGF
jgi:hypothetical protein